MSDHNPSLSLLGGQQWEKSQQKVRESMESIASDLLQLYADRNLNTTDPIDSDSPWQSELEDSFPYTETSDQLLATEDVKKDPDFVKKTLKDILSEPTELRKTKINAGEIDESEIISNELSSLIETDYGIKLQVFSENDPEKYDPKNKARMARPYKPAILIE